MTTMKRRPTRQMIRDVMTEFAALGASKGGFARAESLTRAQRTESARVAALAKWAKWRAAKKTNAL